MRLPRWPSYAFGALALLAFCTVPRARADNGYSGGGSSGGGPSVTGTGLAHVTSGTFDGAAYLGTAGQFATINAGGTDTSWATCSGDVTCSSSTPGLFTVTAISGSTPINITAATVQWLKGTSSPTLTVATPTTDAAPASLTVAAPPAFNTASTNATGASLVLKSGAGASGNGGNFTPGNVVANIGGVPGGSGTEGVFALQRNGTNIGYWGPLIGTLTTSAFYPGTITPSSTNYSFAIGNTGSTTVNSSAGTTTVQSSNGTTIQAAAANGVSMKSGSSVIQILGLNGLGLQAGSAATITNTDVTLTAAQFNYPVIPVTGTMTGSLNLIFPNAVGFWFVDISGVVFGGFTLTLKSGTGTVAITALTTTTDLLIVRTAGSNTIAVNQ